VRRNIIRRAEQAKETRKELIETFFRHRAWPPTHDYSAMLHDIPTSALLDHLQYLIRTGELTRVQGVYHAFENRADRHLYVGRFNEIAAQCALADSGDELTKRFDRICQLAEETDAKLTDLWFRHISPRTRNGIAREAMTEAKPQAASGNVASSDADEGDFVDSRDGVASEHRQLSAPGQRHLC
jgi:hypothetical protein